MNALRTAAVLALSACAAGFAPGPGAATASPFTNAFFGLQNELENRRDNDYPGTLTAAEKKELNAIKAALKTLDKATDDIGDDIKTAGKLANSLKKAFPGEFNTGVTTTLRTFVQNGLTLLHALVDNDYADLQDRVGGMVDAKLIKSVQKSLDQAAAGFEAYAAAPTQSASAKGLLKAWKAVVAGTKAADKDPGGPSGPFLTATIEGVAFTSVHHAAVIHAAGDAVEINASNGDFPAARKAIYLYVEGITGTGTFNIVLSGSEGILNEFPVNNNTPVAYPATSGFLTITVYDPPTRVAGTFNFQATAPASRTVATGAFDITDVTTN